jgi:Fic family protein
MLSPRQQSFLSQNASGAQIRTADYARSAGIAHRTALADLNELARLGLVRRQGKGKTSQWIVA